MLHAAYYPLRTILGSAVAVRSLEPSVADCEVIDATADFRRLGSTPVIRLRRSLGETVSDSQYAHFLPRVFTPDGRSHKPGAGMAELPFPRWQPFPQNAPLLSLFFLAKKSIAEKAARRISVRFRIRLERPALVGGIALGGFPYLPYRINAAGESSSNFGIPREVRLTCLGGSRDAAVRSGNQEFLDSEISVTRQEIAWHSGFQFVTCDPTLTDTLILHLSDFPRIAREYHEPGPRRVEAYEELFGFCLPYFYVFEYREDTRYRPPVSGGYLGARLEPPAKPIEIDPSETTVTQSAQVEHRLFIKDAYYDFTAASAIGTGRTYPNAVPATPGHRPRPLQECFVSRLLGKGERVTLFFEQAEEYPRCIAGVRALLPFVPATNLLEDLKDAIGRIGTSLPAAAPAIDQLADASPALLDRYMRELLGLPAAIPIARNVGVRVYELDPDEGASPLQTPLPGKYALALAEREIDELSEIVDARFIQGIPFLRPSAARYFAVELTNLDTRRGAHIVLRDLELVQSAHVSIHPRPAHTQQVKALNFRIVGADLADDYAALGAEGFNFSIERFVAGERKNVLFRANSLLDLLQSGAARLFGNSRRRAVEFENVRYGRSIDVDPALGEGRESFEIRRNEVSSDGWRRSETGSNRFDPPLVTGKPEWEGALLHWSGEQDPHAPSASGDDFGFSTLGNREVRTHSDNVFPERVDANDNSNEWNAIRSYLNALGALSNLGFSGNLVPNTSRLDRQGWRDRAWTGTAVPRVSGQKSLAVNPLTPIVDLTNFVDDIVHNRPFDPALFGIYVLGNIPLLMSGGGNSSVSVSPGGLGVSVGVQPTPTVNFTHTVGSFGNIAQTASEENYAYAQSRNRSFDQGRVVSYSDKGNQNRIVTRKEVPDTDAERVRGSEVLWQGKTVDILTGTIPLNFTLPAIADKRHARTFDETLRVRIGSGIGRSLSVDVWFDVAEEWIRDDH